MNRIFLFAQYLDRTPKTLPEHNQSLTAEIPQNRKIRRGRAHVSLRPLWQMSRVAAAATFAALCLAASGAHAGDTPKGSMEQVSAHMGMMSVTMPTDVSADAPPERLNLIFEPWQMMEDLFRDDIVLLMRHGPTDWSRRDARDVAPGDCANQRMLSEAGKAAIADLGILMASNGLRPSQVMVSEWCRNQETRDALVSGFKLVDPDYAGDLSIKTAPALNLLLSLQGAPHVTEMRQMISEWEGGDTKGPLLMISHFTNIAELTEFNVYEGEILVLDPKRDNRVLGYLRLNNAAPDQGHFTKSE